MSQLEIYFQLMQADLKDCQKGIFTVHNMISYLIIFGGRG